MEASESIRVLILDEHAMFAQSMAALLAQEPDIDVVGTGSSAAQGIRLLDELRPDVALVDLQLGGASGFEVMRRAGEAHPGTRVVMLTDASGDHLLLEAIDVGCVGFLTRDQAAEEVVRAIRTATEEDMVISPHVLEQLVPRLRRGAQGIGAQLTAREREILGFLVEGRPTGDIAGELVLSVHTIRNYTQSVLTKLGASSKLQAVAIALREGLVTVPGSR